MIVKIYYNYQKKSTNLVVSAIQIQRSVFSRSRRWSTSNCQIMAFPGNPSMRACWGWREHQVTKPLKSDPGSFMMRRCRSLSFALPCSSVFRDTCAPSVSHHQDVHSPQIWSRTTPKGTIDVCVRRFFIRCVILQNFLPQFSIDFCRILKKWCSF